MTVVRIRATGHGNTSGLAGVHGWLTEGVVLFDNGHTLYAVMDGEVEPYVDGQSWADYSHLQHLEFTHCRAWDGWTGRPMPLINLATPCHGCTREDVPA